MTWKRLFYACTFVVILMLMSFQLNAQTAGSGSSVGAKVLFVDYGIANNVGDSRRITNGVELFYRRNFSDKIGLQVPLKLGVAHFKDELNNMNFVNLDILGVYNFSPASSNFIPYAAVGGGILLPEGSLDENVIQFPVGLGFNYKVGPNTYLNVQGEYRLGMEDFRNSLHAGVGLMYTIGKGVKDDDKDGVPNDLDMCPDKPGLAEFKGCPDSDGDKVPDNLDECPEQAGTPETAGCPDIDGDGVADKDDKCPEEKGLKEFDGCPDTDGDGIPDGEDECPEEAGSEEKNGCPDRDTDGDGVNDEIDECPEAAGTAATNGCPDTDGDGIADKDDRCPTQAGEFGGCPDTDGDGIIDPDDVCPDQAGLINNKGCPEIGQEERELLSFAMRAVQFETGRAELKQESFSVLDQIVGIMERYPGYNLTIIGHTDSVGDDETNKVLSEERAKSCYQYIVSKGITPSRLNYEGMGEAKPIASNRTSQGRRLNRRVEFDLKLE
ncbi:MAG: OmpA family protein [Bacteroidota bacterium]